MSEDKAPVNASKWITAEYNRSLKASVEKYPSQCSFLSQTAAFNCSSTAPVKARPSRTADIFYLDESTLVGENVLDSDSSSEEEDKKKGQ